MWQQSENNSYSANCSKVYNKFCPTFYTADCGHCIVGCSAVALGQILWYWRWPDYAEIPKNINRYGGVSGGTIKRYYDWDNMPSYLYNSTDMYKVDAVAKFLRDCGYAEEMWYGGDDWSMAGIAKIKRAMDRNFNLHYNNVHEYSWIDMEQILIDEIDYLRPVLCQAWNNDDELYSHSFVIDGYNIVSDEVKFHINWGWGEYCNDFYDLGFSGYDGNRTFLTEIYPDCSVRSNVINGISETQIISDTIANYYSTDDIVLNQTNSPLTIEGGGHLIVESGSSISLKPGFHAKIGSSVRLSIRDICTTSGVSRTMLAKYHYEGEKLSSQNSKLILSPNQTNDIITITSHEQLEDIRIYTVTGQCVLQTKQTEINMSTFSAGIYIVTVTTSNGNMLQSKFFHQ